MARSAAAARLLASSLSPFRSSHHPRQRRPLLLPTSRSKTYSAKPLRPSSRTGKPAAPSVSRPSLFQEISGVIDSVAGPVSDPPSQPRVTGQLCSGDETLLQCPEGARPKVPESAAATSASFPGRVPPRGEASCQEVVAGDGNAQDSDIDIISADVQRVTEVLLSEVPGLSLEQRLGNLGVTYTPRLVNMVLKRCFKKRQFGFRFFYWVKQVPGFRHTTETYNTMLYIAGEARNFESMEELMGEMDTKMCVKDIKTWTIIIDGYGKARQTAKMLSTFYALEKSGSVVVDTKVYRTILRALCNDERHELALEFYKDMPASIVVGSYILRLLLCLLARSNNAEAVFLIRDDMIKSMRYPEEYCYSEVLRSFCVSGKIVEAKKVFQQMINKSMASSSAFEIFLRGLCRSGRMDEALQVIEHMKNRSSISSTAFGFVIDGYLREGNRTKALELLQAMREYGCVPLASSYTQLMQHLFTFDQYEAACQLYEEMKEIGVQPDTVTITALIAGHIHSGNISEAWNLLRKINQSGQRPTIKAYTVFIQELCKASMPLEALELLKEMLECDFRPSGETFYRIISSLRHKNFLGEASIVERMRASLCLRRPREDMECGPSEKGNTIDEFQKLSESDPEERKSSKSASDKDYTAPRCSIYDGVHRIEQAKRYSDEDVEEICQILSSSDNWSSIQQALEMRSLHFTPELVIAIMKRCKRKGHAALKFFYWVGKRSYYMQTTDTYNLAMKLAGSAKDFKHMRHLYREMAWAECSPTVDTWNIMICQYGNAGLTEMALETFYQMKQEGFQPGRSTYNHLIMYVSRRKGRKVDAAIKIFKEMTNAGYILDSQVLCGYILALCECGMLVDARTSIVSLCKQGFPAQIGYSILLRSLCRSDRKEEAVSLFDDIEKCGCFRNEHTYGSLIHALLRWDRFEDAVAKLAEMKNACICQSTHIYTSFIIYFFQKRDVAKAMGMFKEMAENGCEPTVVTYSALIRGLMGMGRVSEAWDVLRRMKLKGPLPDFETYSMFITYLCKAGRSEDGLQLIHDMLDGGIIPSAVNFRTVVHGLNMEGKHKLADSVLQSKWHVRRQRSFSEDSFV
ncbi:putative pentatricopeptide repeat-containing protein At5g06400, mitochondrial [Lolium perenne]|uniref:putative pentatricopeptide repeat-containing protein At5g06400, mitochondrial n=1 Tax=Lolium perenne TaxID=4522 RepID=UPI0021EAAD49|nr:putative pentatricopeptide repeat-containing protein At5g06400, mitochondrial [Lolium perenne]